MTSASYTLYGLGSENARGRVFVSVLGGVSH